MLSRPIVLFSLIYPLLALDAGAVFGITFGAVLVTFFLLFIFIYIIVTGCSDDIEEEVYIEPMPIVPAPFDPYLLPTQTATPFIAQNIANAYINTTGPATTNQFLVNPYPNTSPFPPPLPHLQAIHPINPTATYLGRDTCSICFDGGTNIKLVPCTHQFHANCIVEWCNKRRVCPNCNATNFQALVLCSTCHRFNESVTFCPVGCQKPNHMDCFMQRNGGKMVCRGCLGGGVGMGVAMGGGVGMVAPLPVIAHPVSNFSQQRLMVSPAATNYYPQQIMYR